MPQTFQILPEANRQIGKTFSTSAQVPADCARVEGEITMNTATRTDEQNRCRWSIDIGPTSSGPWTPVHIDDWSGGTITDHAGNVIPRPSRLTILCQPEWRGQWAQFTLDILDSMRCGAEVTVYSTGEVTP